MAIVKPSILYVQNCGCGESIQSAASKRDAGVTFTFYINREFRQMTVPLEQRLTVPMSEFVELSGLGRPTAQRMVKDGTLQSIAVGNKRLILVRSYLDFIERTRREQTTGSQKLPPLGKWRKGAKAAVEA